MEEKTCEGNFKSGKELVNKLRSMGYSQLLLPLPLEVKCQHCGEMFTMQEFESKCPKCGMVHGIAVCHADDAKNVMGAGIDY
ncbi:MAG: hypothetical protein WCR36_03355 [Bacteroidaceae bacterium]